MWQEPRLYIPDNFMEGINTTDPNVMVPVNLELVNHLWLPNVFIYNLKTFKARLKLQCNEKWSVRQFWLKSVENWNKLLYPLNQSYEGRFYDYMPKTQIFVRDMIFCIFILWILYFVVYFEDCLFNGKNYQENWLLFIGWISNFDFLVFFNVSLSKNLIDFDKFFLFLGCAGALKARRTLGHKKSRSHVFTGSIFT